MPVTRGVAERLTGEWQAGLLEAPTKAPVAFSCGCCCPCLLAARQRLQILDLIGEPYLCCGGLFPCGPLRHPQDRCCAWPEAFCCVPFAAAGNRVLIQTRLGKRNTAWDDWLVRAACLPSSVATCCSHAGMATPDGAENCVDCFAICALSCLLAQQQVETEHAAKHGLGRPNVPAAAAPPAQLDMARDRGAATLGSESEKAAPVTTASTSEKLGAGKAERPRRSSLSAAGPASATFGAQRKGGGEGPALGPSARPLVMSAAIAAGAAAAGAEARAQRPALQQPQPPPPPAVASSGLGRAVPALVAGGFMDCASPDGSTWQQRCEGTLVAVDAETGFPEGVWGECIAWAKLFEFQNPDFDKDARYADGPCRQVIQAMKAACRGCTPELAAQAALRLEAECDRAALARQPLPVIQRKVR